MQIFVRGPNNATFYFFRAIANINMPHRKEGKLIKLILKMSTRLNIKYIIFWIFLTIYQNMLRRTHYSLLPSDLSIVHGNHRPITLAQSILYDKYIIIPRARMLTAAPTANVNGVLVFEIN